MPERLLYPYPMPNLFGLVMDPKKKARVREIVSGSPAERQGWQADDEIVTLAGQPLVSIADIQWVLHNAPDIGNLPAEVVRDGTKRSLSLPLEAGWRQKGNISWRASSWDLRRMTTGGMRLDELSNDARRELGLHEGVLALRVRYLGEFGNHAVAKNAGFRKGDVLVEMNGNNAPLTESQLMASLINAKRPGEHVAITVMRDGKQIRLELPMQ